MTVPIQIPQDVQARRVRLLSRLERRIALMDLTLGRLSRLRALIRAVMTRLRTGEDPGVIEAELRRLGWRR